MVKTAKLAAHNLSAAIARIFFIFLILTIGLDSVTRIYYSYMPIDNWMDFRSVEVRNIDGEPSVVIHRKPHRSSISVFHRTLLIRYPEKMAESRGCTASTLTVMDDFAAEEIIVPLSRMLSQTCPEVIGNRTLDSVLQVSYIFEFPYGVKRMAVRYSNRFLLSYNGSFVVTDTTKLGSN